jgi:hypothetical protein
MKNMLDPSEGPADPPHFIYTMAEAYAADASVAKHMELTANFPDMAKMLEFQKEYGIMGTAGTQKILTNMMDA